MIRGGFTASEAFGCSDEFRLAAVVVLAGFEGNEFDWELARFKERN